MNPPYMKEMVIAGLWKSASEGVQSWGIQSFSGCINPRGYKNEVNDPEIQQMLKEIEQEGLIKLVGTDDCYLKILIKYDYGPASK